MRRFAMLAAAGAVFGAASAHASPVVVFPPTTIGLQVGGSFAFGPGFVRVGNDEAIGSLTAGGPSITAEGSTPPPFFTSQSVDATATWDFEVVGGPAGGPSGDVGVIINGLYSAATIGHAGTVANVFVGDNFRDFSNVFTEDCFSGIGDCTQHGFTASASVLVDSVQEIELHVGGAVTGPVGSFSVTLDPIITLAPGFADQGYRLLVAPDAQPPAGGVPEPAAWALMILGFGGVGAALRRRRTGAMPAAGASR